MAPNENENYRNRKPFFHLFIPALTKDVVHFKLTISNRLKFIYKYIHILVRTHRKKQDQLELQSVIGPFI